MRSAVLADSGPLYAAVDPDDAYHPQAQRELFNATLAVLAARLGVAVWTYDHHFDIMRVEVWR
jgi:hypothetical protein